MQSGKLRHQLTIQTRSTTADSVGQPVESWTDGQTVWASVNPLQGRELEYAQAVNSETSHKVTIRYLSGLTTGNRLKFGTRVFEILSIINMDERNIQLVLMCKEWN